MLNIVLYQPEIPQNTGNISRTCAATHSRLHLIGPLGFSLADKYLKRAGLDYWPLLELHQYESYEEFLQKNPGAHIYMASTKGAHNYSDVVFQDEDYLMFGPETRGLPEEMLRENYDQVIRIPILQAARSLNLSNSVAIVTFEALRQMNFPGLLEEGSIPTP